MSQVVVYRLILESETPPREFPLTTEYVYIGRAPDNDVVIENEHVSRQHARLIRQKDRYLLEDLDSTNGTFVNEKRITHAVLLEPGDRIRLGPEVVLRFAGPEMDLDPTVRVPVVEAPGEPARASSPEVQPVQPLVTPPPAPPLASTPPPGEARPPASPPPATSTPVPQPAAPAAPVEAQPVPPASVPATRVTVGSLTPGREIVYTPQRPGWTWVALGCAGVAALALGACIAWLWWVDTNNLWCTYEFFRRLLPGCP